jgi:hypothetical protein
MNSDELLPQVYAELRRLAAAKLAGERQGHTLDATALVHERRPAGHRMDGAVKRTLR